MWSSRQLFKHTSMEGAITSGAYQAQFVHSELCSSIVHCQERGLYIAAKWASEQLGGLYENEAPEEESDDDEMEVRDERLQMVEETKVSRQAQSQYLRGKACFDVKEYLRAAEILKNGTSKKTQFLRWYSLFLAGEKQKDEEQFDVKEQCPVVNTELRNLKEELEGHWEQGELDAFGQYLYGVVLQELKLNAQALDVLLRSCNSYPWNWSAWVALSTLCVDSATLQQVQEQLLPHYVADYFLALAQQELQMNEDALDRYDQLKMIFPTSRYLLQQIGACQFSLQDFGAAEESFEKMREIDPYAMEGLDIYSNILYVNADAGKLSYLAHYTATIDRYRAETCFIIGNYYSLKDQHLKAVLYFQRALKLNKHFLSAWTLMGHEYVELKKPEAALYSYRKAVDCNPRDYRALYGLGQLYEVLKLTQYAVYYYHKAALLRPYDSRMWCALAFSYESLEKNEEAIKCYERAVANGDREGLAIRKLAKLYAHIEDHSKSAYYYKMTLDRLDATNGRDADIVDALVALGDYCESVNKIEDAVGYYERLLAYKGRAKEHAKDRLFRIYNRTSAQPSQS